MPWQVAKRGGEFVVIQQGSGKVVGKHGSDKGAAEKHLRALNANYHGKKRTSGGGNDLRLAAARRGKRKKGSR